MQPRWWDEYRCQDSTFNQLDQYASCPGNRAYRYAKLVISSLGLCITVASTHSAYMQRGGQAELAWVARTDTKTV